MRSISYIVKLIITLLIWLAILQVEAAIVYFHEDLGPASVGDDFLTIYENDGHQVLRGTGTFTNADITGASLVILHDGSSTSFLSTEIEALQNILNSGGNVMFWTDNDASHSAFNGAISSLGGNMSFSGIVNGSRVVITKLQGLVQDHGFTDGVDEWLYHFPASMNVSGDANVLVSTTNGTPILATQDIGLGQLIGLSDKTMNGVLRSSVNEIDSIYAERFWQNIVPESSIPEPSTYALILNGLIGIAIVTKHILKQKYYL